VIKSEKMVWILQVNNVSIMCQYYDL
jgi:hypothetical protein